MSRENEKRLRALIDHARVPGHIAIIMDGNGRWAEKQGLPRQEGHRQGMETVRAIVKSGSSLGVGTLTLFAFSTENWKRPPGEVNFLMSLPEQYFKSELPELMRQNVQVRLLGDPGRLPARVREIVKKGTEKTAANRGMILNIALNYGARAEIIHAVNTLLEECLSGRVKKVSEKVFSGYLYTASLPDPDLLIRTGGDQRISNFLLWQLAYSELWFTDTYWPAFSEADFLEAVYGYQQRKRRFGRL